MNVHVNKPAPLINSIFIQSDVDVVASNTQFTLNTKLYIKSKLFEETCLFTFTNVGSYGDIDLHNCLFTIERRNTSFISMSIRYIYKFTPILNIDNRKFEYLCIYPEGLPRLC